VGVPLVAGATGSCPGTLVRSGSVCLEPNNNFNTGVAGSSTLPGLVVNVIQLILIFSGSVAVLVLIYGGFLYLTSAGNEEQGEKGKSAFLNAVLGLVVIVLAFTIVRVISSTLTGADKLV